MLALDLHFQHIGLNLQENQMYYSKESKVLFSNQQYH